MLNGLLLATSISDLKQTEMQVAAQLKATSAETDELLLNKEAQLTGAAQAHAELTEELGKTKAALDCKDALAAQLSGRVAGAKKDGNQRIRLRVSTPAMLPVFPPPVFCTVQQGGALQRFPLPGERAIPSPDPLA